MISLLRKTLTSGSQDKPEVAEEAVEVTVDEAVEATENLKLEEDDQEVR